jgi:ferredoxin
MFLFYFTGTGNSLYAAKSIAAATSARLISIPQAVKNPREYADDVIGFVYPQYAIGLPKIVRKFVTENKFTADYTFAIDLYAFISAGALREMSGILHLDYGEYLKTPNNFTVVFNPPKDAERSLEKTQARLGGIIADIQARKIKAVKPSNRVGNATKYFGESGFKTTEACTKCGLCARICPAGNIAIGEAVVFGNRCETCYGCANLCPQHAIYANQAMLRRRRYRNPYVSVDEIIAANNQGSR